MARVLLACLVGKVTKSTMLAFRSLLDFIYLAQYPTHDDETLTYMEDALKTFHKNKNVLIQLGVREDLDIPKIHSLMHYVQAIRNFGTTDNYNTEMFERLHIDFAKKAWRATNHRDEFPQMVQWITRNEKMAMYEMFQKERLTEEALDELSQDEDDDQDQEAEEDQGDIADSEDSPGHARASAKEASDLINVGMKSLKIAKYPPSPQQHLTRIQEHHKAPGFTTALVHYINDLQPEPLRLDRHDLARTWLPFDRIDIYHKFQFNPCELSDGREERDVIKAIPASGRTGRKDRFDTAIVLDTQDAESTGIQGELIS